MRTIQFGSIYHMPWLEYRHALPDGRVCLRLKTGRNEFSRVAARENGMLITLEPGQVYECGFEMELTDDPALIERYKKLAN